MVQEVVGNRREREELEDGAGQEKVLGSWRLGSSFTHSVSIYFALTVCRNSGE